MLAEDDDTDDKRSFGVFLDQMVQDDLLEARMEGRDYDRSYRLTDQGVYGSSFDELPLVIEHDETGTGGSALVDSSPWTGLSRVRITHRNALAISGLIDVALAELAADDNVSTAQARTLLLAAKTLTDAPEPPSDIIWDLIQHAAGVVGLLDIFLRIFSAAVN